MTVEKAVARISAEGSRIPREQRLPLERMDDDCGDSTVATDVERVLGGVAPHLMITDLPYGVSYDPVRAAVAKIVSTQIGRLRLKGNLPCTSSGRSSSGSSQV
jgi:hypothetical protein